MVKSHRNYAADDSAVAPSNKGALLARRHHLDPHASRLAELGDGNPDDLLSTRAVSDWLGVSIQFLEIGRSRSYGPKFIRVAPARIRYRRSDVIVWLEERTFASTSQYGEVL